MKSYGKNIAKLTLWGNKPSWNDTFPQGGFFVFQSQLVSKAILFVRINFVVKIPGLRVFAMFFRQVNHQ